VWVGIWESTLLTNGFAGFAAAGETSTRTAATIGHPGSGWAILNAGFTFDAIVFIVSH
jgi:hypothetical protein